MGLGLASLGRPGYINIGHADDLRHDYEFSAMRGRCHAVLDAAWGLGVRYFDAARSYGRAEEFLAKWLQKREVPPEEVTVGSKWGYTYTADWQVEAKHHEIKNHSLPLLQKQCVESTRILGKQLDLYQIHSATLESGVLADEAVLEELAWLRDQGMCIGLSVSGPRQAEALQVAMEIMVGGKRVFDCVQATWNVLETAVGPALKTAHEHGMGVIIKEALANGRLTSRNKDPEFASQRQLLASEASRLETTVDGLALAAVLAQPWVDVVLSGAATVEQLNSNVGALKVTWDQEAQERLARIAETSEDYWATRAKLAWN